MKYTHIRPIRMIASGMIAMTVTWAAMAQPQDAPQPTDSPDDKPTSLGLIPLTELGAGTYKGEDGGLYGGGRNEPPAEHAQAARAAIARIQPLNAEGEPDPDGRIVLMSIGMSNTTQEFGPFAQRMRDDADKSPRVLVLDAAHGAMEISYWSDTQKRHPNRGYTAWEQMRQKLEAAGVTPQQVQAVWIKLAKAGPQRDGDFPAHAQRFRDDFITVLNLARQEFPNLQVAYLSSRIYAGYATVGLNPEPYAYEYGFAVRWLIQAQIDGDPRLNHDPERGKVNSPLLLWGPYLWADGTTPRADGLVWNREDLREDGTHPGDSGVRKVGVMLTDFFKHDPFARPWFVGQ